MRSDNLQLPRVQTSTSSNNLQLHHGRHGHGHHGGHVGHSGCGGRGEHGDHDSCGGQDRTRLTFKLDFPGNL